MIWIAIVLPETRGLPLEEIEALFGNSQDIMLFISPDNHGREHGQEKGMTEHVEG